MSKTIITVPLDFEANTNNPRDRNLFDAAQNFCKEQFGAEYSFHLNGKNWCVIEVSDEGEGFEVIAVSGMVWVPDCRLFHVKPGTNKETWKRAEDVSTALMKRMAAYLQDSIGLGTRVLVFVEPKTEGIWKRFLRRVGAKPANRYEVTV